MWTLANDRTIVIKKADKGWCVVVWDRDNYIAEAEKQLSDKVCTGMLILTVKSCKILLKQVIASLKIRKEKGK